MLQKRLSQLISSLGIKKIDFARRIGFSQAYVSMLLTGQRKAPSDRFVDAVSREFQVSPEWLTEGKGDMFLYTSEDMSSSDMQLLRKYKKLPLREQGIIEEIVDAMLMKVHREKGEPD